MKLSLLVLWIINCIALIFILLHIHYEHKLQTQKQIQDEQKDWLYVVLSTHDLKDKTQYVAFKDLHLAIHLDYNREHELLSISITEK